MNPELRDFTAMLTMRTVLKPLTPVLSGMFQPEETNMLKQKKERRTMMTMTGKSIVEF